MRPHIRRKQRLVLAIALALAVVGCSSSSVPTAPAPSAGQYAGVWSQLFFAGDTANAVTVNASGRFVASLGNGRFQVDGTINSEGQVAGTVHVSGVLPPYDNSLMSGTCGTLTSCSAQAKGPGPAGWVVLRR